MYPSNHQHRSSNGSDYYYHGENSRSQRRSDPNIIDGGNGRPSISSYSMSNASNSTTASKPVSYSTQSSKKEPPTIALFGMGSKTARHFLRQALDAGYHVRALIIQQSSSTSKKELETSNEVSHLYDCDPLVHDIALRLRDDFSAQESLSTLHWIYADCIFDVHAVRRTLRNAQYVVCMMQDGAPITSYCVHSEQISNNKTKKGSFMIPMNSTSQSLCVDHTKPIASFINLLYPIMKEEMSIKVFLYQANSLAPDLKGKTPMFSKVLKTASAVRNVFPIGRPNSTTAFTLTNNYSDQNSVLQEIARHHRRPKQLANDDSIRKLRESLCSEYHSSKGHQEVNEEDLENAEPMNQHSLPEPHFSYIITRPTSFLKDGASGRKVSASKSQPGPFPISHCDLAEFSLNALVNQKLYNSCPYVVADSF